MQELLEEGYRSPQEDRQLTSGSNKIDARPEFSLTDAEIDEALRPVSGLSLEARIQKVLDSRSKAYDYEEEEEEEEEMILDVPRGLQKGQQRNLGRNTGGRRGKRGRNKKLGDNRGQGEGRNNNAKKNKRGDKKGKREKRGKRGGGTNKHNVMKYPNKQYRNVCLDPPDR